MRLSDAGAKLLMQREGFKNDAYLDTKGIPTIGVGHTGNDFKMGDHWSDDQVLAAFKRDSAWVEAAVNRCTQPLNQNMFDALVSFVYNVGATAFANSTMLKFLNMGLYKSAWMEFDRWHVPVEITDRRNQEKAQFATAI